MSDDIVIEYRSSKIKKSNDKNLDEKSFLKHMKLRLVRIKRFPLTYKEFLAIYEAHKLDAVKVDREKE